MRSRSSVASRKPISKGSFSYARYLNGYSNISGRFPAAIDYLDSGKVKVDGIVNKTFKLEQWSECLEAMRNKSAIKAAITFD